MKMILQHQSQVSINNKIMYNFYLSHLPIPNRIFSIFFWIIFLPFRTHSKGKVAYATNGSKVILADPLVSWRERQCKINTNFSEISLLFHFLSIYLRVFVLISKWRSKYLSKICQIPVYRTNKMKNTVTGKTADLI